MAGEIHGIIDREQAWAMWKPYGERETELSDNLRLDDINPVEAVHIISGADDEEVGACEETLNESDYEAFGKFEDEGHRGIERSNLRMPREMTDCLRKQQILQTERAKQLSVEWANHANLFMKLLGKGASMLQRDGILLPDQVDRVNYWLTDESGQPRIEYIPTTKLGLARYVKNNGTPMPVPDLPASTNLGEGYIIHPVELGEEIRRKHNRVHEHVHATFSGGEFYDITHDDGLRIPVATVVGLFAYEPSTAICDMHDYSDVLNGEINEAVTDFLTRSMIDAVPQLGEYEKGSTTYSEWAERIAKLRASQPGLFRKIIDTYFVDTTTLQPSAKRDALEEMHEYANKRMSAKNALTNYMTEGTGTLQQVKHA